MVLDGNYHGTDMLPQYMRGMWPGMVTRFEVIALQPNDRPALEAAFREHGSRVAGFWAEPVMMNREAIALDADYLQLAQRCCREVGALLCLDEIQTGFWRPEIFEYRAMGLQPDLVVLGKGMTAGFHPLSGVLFHHRHDVLEQYDAISTNGSAALPAFVALCSLELIAQRAPQIRAIGQRIQDGFQTLAAEFPGVIHAAHGRGYLAGLKFHEVEDAKRFQRLLLADGALDPRARLPRRPSHRAHQTRTVGRRSRRGLCAGAIQEATQERKSMNAAARPRVGLLALTLELYETLAPGCARLVKPGCVGS